ncbi:serine/arginine repetitive matrix protein 2-like [Lineus longissimus]|uniref:serine/arginine repetitive matrix protein 2-like n=1 Tax=Lineus longissimus TaxID=88925 RepID=UPI00315D63F8
MQRLLDEETVKNLQRRSLDLLDLGVPPLLQAALVTKEVEEEEAVGCPATKRLLDDIKQSMEAGASSDVIGENGSRIEETVTNGLQTGAVKGETDSSSTHSAISAGRINTGSMSPVLRKMCPASPQEDKDKSLGCKSHSPSPDSEGCLGYKSESSEGDGYLGYKSEFSDSDDSLGRSVDLHTLDKAAFVRMSTGKPPESVPLLQMKAKENTSDFTSRAENGVTKVAGITGQQASPFQLLAVDSDNSSINEEELDEVIKTIVEADETGSMVHQVASGLLDQLVMGPEVIPTLFKQDETGEMVRTEPVGSYPPRIEDGDLLGHSPRRFLKAASPMACRMESPSFLMRTGLAKKTDSDSDTSADMSPSDDIRPDESVRSQMEIDTAHARSVMQESLAAYVTSTAAEHVSSLIELSNQRTTSFLRSPVADQAVVETGTNNSDNSTITLSQSNLIPPCYSNETGSSQDEHSHHVQTLPDDVSKDSKNKPAHFEYAQRMRFRATSTTIKTVSPEQGTAERGQNITGGATNPELQKQVLETTPNSDDRTQSEYTEPIIPERTISESSTREYEKLRFFDRQAPLVETNEQPRDSGRARNEEDDKNVQGNLFGDISFWSVPIPFVKDSDLGELSFPKAANDSTESHAHPAATAPATAPATSDMTSPQKDSSDAFLDFSGRLGRFVVSNEYLDQQTQVQRERKEGESDSPKIDDLPNFVARVEHITEVLTPTPTKHHEVNDAVETSSDVSDHLGALDSLAQKVQKATDRINDANRELCMQRIENVQNLSGLDSIPIGEANINRTSSEDMTEIKTERKREELDTDHEQETAKCQRTSSPYELAGIVIISPAPIQQAERQEQEVTKRRSRSPTPSLIIVTGPTPEEVSVGMDVSVGRSRSPTPTPLVIMTPCLSPDSDPLRRPVSSTRRSRSRERRKAKRHRSLSPREKAFKSPRSLSPRADSRSPSPGRQRRSDRLMASPYDRPMSQGESPRSPSPQPTRIPGPTTPYLSSPRRDPSPVPSQRQTPALGISSSPRRSRSPSPLLDASKPCSNDRRSRSHSRSPRPDNTQETGDNRALALSPHPPSRPKSPRPDLRRASRRPGTRSRSPVPWGTFGVRHDQYEDLVMAQQETLASNLSISSKERNGRRPRQKLIHKDSRDQNAILEQLKTKHLPYLAKKFNRIPESCIPDVGFILDDMDFINALDALRRAPYFVGGALLSEYSFMNDVYQQVVEFPSIFRTFKKLLEILFHVFTEGFTAPEIGVVVVGNIYTILINGSDVHEEFLKRLSEEPGLLELIVWFVKRVKNVPANKDAVGMLLTYSINVLYNCSMHDDNRKRLQEVGAVDACLNYLESSTEFVERIALLCVAYLADEKQSEIFLAKRKPIQHFIDQLKKAVTDGTERGADGWTKLEIIKGLGRLSVNDSNKRVIAECGAMDVLLEAAQVDASPRERLESLKVLWSLCFDKTNQEQLKNNTEAMVYFEQIGVNDLDPKSQKVANGILWTIRDSLQHHSTLDQPSEGQSHIMVSYQWEAKPLALKMRATLRANGYNVWMDVDHMQGSTIETMARAVEMSDAVLMCMSQKYKESQNCRSEAEYAYYQKKEIIPIVVQNKYKPDGWLGFLRGTKMYYDITSDDAFQEKMTDLIKALGNKGKLQGSPLNVPPHQAFITEQHEPSTVTPPVHPVTERARTPRVRSSPRNWSDEDVTSWMESHGINRNRMGVLTGRQISFLQKMKRDAPDFYYSYVTKNLYSIQFQEFTDFSALTSAIEELDEAEK